MGPVSIFEHPISHDLLFLYGNAFPELDIFPVASGQVRQKNNGVRILGSAEATGKKFASRLYKRTGLRVTRRCLGLPGPRPKKNPEGVSVRGHSE